MAHEQLQQARTELEEAAETADGDVRETLRETASAFAELVSADREPDHAVFDGHLNDLRQASEHADGETERRVERALEHAESYREGLDQA